MNYTNMDSYIISELKLIINDLNKFPTQSNLISLNKGSLLHKINKNGGLDFSDLPVYNLTKKGNQMQNLMPSVKFNYFYVKT